MTIKISVYIATSLDGFIARKNGEIDWLLAGNNGGEDYGYTEFISSIDQIVMGRNTYEKVLTLGEWPYSGKKAGVLTSHNLQVSHELAGKVEVFNMSPRELVHTLESRGAKHIYLDGGDTTQRFLREGLVDEMTITIIPILIGEGLPLFGALDGDIKLEVVKSQSFKNGFVQNRYKIL